MTSNFGDVTVVGDAPFKHSESPFNIDILKGPNTAKIGLPKKPRSEFTTTDYTLQERPFFVPIGAGGLLAALQKLDRQLLNVGSWLCINFVLFWDSRWR